MLYELLLLTSLDEAYEFADAFILVCSVDRAYSLFKDGVEKFISEIMETKKLLTIRHIPFILVVNKIDLPLQEHEISEEEIEDQVKKYRIPVWRKISCKQDVGLKEMYLNLIDQMVKKMYWEHLLCNAEKTEKKKCQIM